MRCVDYSFAMNSQREIRRGEHGNVPVRRTRLDPETRKAAIAQVAAEIFARAGFAATGFRDIARASRTSEALVYRYFPTKQALWDAALEAVRGNAASQFIRQTQIGEPSAGALVELTLELAKRFLSDAISMQPAKRETLNRMLLRSLSEDASFARYMFAAMNDGLSRDFKDCLHAARKAGDMEPSLSDDSLLAILYFNLFFLVSSLQMQGLIAKEAEPDHLQRSIFDLVEFQLRGIGLRSDTVNREMARIRTLTI